MKRAPLNKAELTEILQLPFGNYFICSAPDVFGRTILNIAAIVGVKRHFQWIKLTM